jgi:small subunit ribosomal protein S13
LVIDNKAENMNEDISRKKNENSKEDSKKSESSNIDPNKKNDKLKNLREEKKNEKEKVVTKESDKQIDKTDLSDIKKNDLKKIQKDTKKDHKKDDFKYIIRLSNTDINGEKKVVYGLTTIKGIGLHMATLICDETKIDRYMKIGDLSDDQIEKLQQAIDTVGDNAPTWMLNHRKDYDTGSDIHLIGNDIDLRLRDEINIMKKIRSYRGIRHERSLPVRGQRTRANNRKGLALGVSKKRETK